MPQVVLDASVLLALLKSERFDNATWQVVEGAVISAVNYAEVLSKLADLGLTQLPATESLLALLDRIEPFTASQARIVSALRASTRGQGLSLGDRACLALGLELHADVYTADQVWAKLEVGCVIHLIREAPDSVQ